MLASDYLRLDDNKLEAVIGDREKRIVERRRMAAKEEVDGFRDFWDVKVNED